MAEWGRPCALTRKVKTPGKYSLVENDKYIVYVSEDIARYMYFGPRGPTEEQMDELGDDYLSLYDDVQIFHKPSLLHDACGFIDNDPPVEDSRMGEPIIVPFLSDLVENAEEFLNLVGIGSPILNKLGVKYAVLTDDMAEQLKGV